MVPMDSTRADGTRVASRPHTTDGPDDDGRRTTAMVSEESRRAAARARLAALAGVGGAESGGRGGGRTRGGGGEEDDGATATRAMRAIECALGGDDDVSFDDEEEDEEDSDAFAGGSESEDFGDDFASDGDDLDLDLDDGTLARPRKSGKKSGTTKKMKDVGMDDDGRLRMRGPIEMEGAEYAGRSASRSDFERDAPEAASSDEDEDEDEDEEGGEENEEDDSDADPYADEDEDAYVAYDADEAGPSAEGGDDDDNDDDDDDDEDEDDDDFDEKGARARDLLSAATEGDDDLARELQAFRQEEEQTKKLVDTKAQHVAKGKAVRAQRTIWERALHARIRLQKVMSSAARLPTANACRGLKRAAPDAGEALDALSQMARKTMRSLTALQTALMGNIDDIKLGERSTIVDVDDALDDVWAKTDAGYRAYSSYRDSTCDRWYRKSAVSVGKTSGGGSSNLKAFNQSISQQVSSTMRAPTRLIEKSQPPKRVAPARLGEKPAENATDDENRDETVNVDGLDEGEAREPELYDDVDFYEQLLKEFLESGNDAGAAGAPSLSKQVKRRKNVDRKASKGRKLRYHVQEPLVNFMQANDVEVPTWAERVFTQLFASHA